MKQIDLLFEKVKDENITVKHFVDLTNEICRWLSSEYISDNLSEKYKKRCSESLYALFEQGEKMSQHPDCDIDEFLMLTAVLRNITQTAVIGNY